MRPDDEELLVILFAEHRDVRVTMLNSLATTVATPAKCPGRKLAAPGLPESPRTVITVGWGTAIGVDLGDRRREQQIAVRLAQQPLILVQGARIGRKVLGWPELHRS